jgi:hypothetical protein
MKKAYSKDDYSASPERKRKLLRTSSNQKSRGNQMNDEVEMEWGVKDDEEEVEDDDEEVEWVLAHSSVGSNVAAVFFDKNSQKDKIFVGKVTKYAKESVPGSADELYHILWQDGDEEDYDTTQLTEGMSCYIKNVVSSEQEGTASASSSTRTRYDYPVALKLKLKF